MVTVWLQSHETTEKLGNVTTPKQVWLHSKISFFLRQKDKDETRAGLRPSEAPPPHPEMKLRGLLQQISQKTDGFKMSSIMYDVIICSN